MLGVNLQLLKKKTYGPPFDYFENL